MLNQASSESRDDRLYVKRRRLFNRGGMRRCLIVEGRRLYEEMSPLQQGIRHSHLLKTQETQKLRLINERLMQITINLRLMNHISHVHVINLVLNMQTSTNQLRKPMFINQKRIKELKSLRTRGPYMLKTLVRLLTSPSEVI